MSRNEVTDLLLEELDKYGLKGTISDRGKHLEVSWETSQGSRFVIAPKTPSDWRSGLNTRSDLRKMLRTDNIPLKQESATSFQRAMSLPKEPLVTQIARDKILQRDLETLADLVLELQDQNNALQQQVSTLLSKLDSVTVVSTVMSTVSFAGQQVLDQSKQIEPKPIERHERVSSNEIVLSNVGFEWTTRQEILKKSAGLSLPVVSQCLIRLRKRGLVENGLRGMWRRLPNDNS